jgi:hypothetical protein
MSKSLTPEERETVIVFSDADGIATITTHQRRILTKLRNNPAAREVEDLSYGTTAGARFELPVSLLSFRTRVRTGRTGGNPEALRAYREKAATHA